jgi:anti-sigma-K factor RskA
MMNHDQASELLAALSLDAVDAEERRQIEEHVAGCQRCQRELDSLRAVAGAMGNLVEPLPESVWTNISNQMYDDGAPVPALAPLPDDVRAPRAGAAYPWRRARWLAVPLAVAAAVVVVLALQLSGANGRITNLQSALRAGAVGSALRTPGHRVVDLSGPTHDELAKFVMLPDGRGYLVSSTLPPLATDQTYQLWGVVNGRAISIGLMGRSPRDVTFTVSGSPAPTTLGVTVEPAGGSPTPTSSMVASGAV